MTDDRGPGQVYLQQVKQPDVPHGMNTLPPGVKMGKKNWSHTSPAQKAFCLLRRKGRHVAAVADEHGLHKLEETLDFGAYLYCYGLLTFSYSFSVDGLKVLVAQDRRVIEIDLVTHETRTIHTTRRKGDVLCGYAGSGVYLLVGKQLSFHLQQDGALVEAWRCAISANVERVFDTGTSVVALVPKTKKSRLVFACLDERGARQLSRVDGLDHFASWYYRPPAGGPTRVFIRDSTTNVYEILNTEGQQVAEPAPAAQIMNRAALEALPETVVAPIPPPQGESASARLIRTMDELDHDKRANLFDNRFRKLDLGPDSKAVETFSWKARPWSGLLRSYSQEQVFVLFAKFMAYMFFKYPHTVIRLWQKVAGAYPDDELVARLCVKVIMEGYFQPQQVDDLMAPAQLRGVFDWAAIARDTMEQPTEKAAVNLVAWGAPRRIQGLKAYLEPFLDGYPEWTLERIAPGLEQLDRPAAEAPAPEAPVPAGVRREQLEQLLRRADDPKERILAFQQLGELGERIGLTGDTLEETQLPWLGFDHDGRRVVQYASRELRLELGDDLELRFEWPAGKLTRTLPRKTKQDTPEQIKAGRQEIATIRRGIEAIARRCAERLERSMVDSLTWPAWRFRALFLDHPVVARIGRSLVFERMGAGKKPGRFFSLAEDGSPRDRRGKPVSLDLDASGAGDASVRLAHPLRMSAEQVAWFEAQIAGRPLEPALAQLKRPVYAARQDPLEALVAAGAGAGAGAGDERRIDARTLVKTFKQVGYAPGPLDEEHNVAICDHRRQLGDGLVMIVWHSPLPARVDQLGRQERAGLRSAEFRRDDKQVDPAEVEAVVYSETVTQLRRIARL